MSSGPLTDSRDQQDATGDGDFASLAPAKHMLLTTFTPDGKPVATSQRVVVDGDRAYFRTGHLTGPSRRLQDGGWVQVAPCSVLGFIRYGLPLDATARLLAGEEAGPAAVTLTSKYPGRPRFLRRLFHRVLRRETAYYELRACPAERRTAA